MRYIFILLLMGFMCKLAAQDGIKILNYHQSDVDKRDFNQLYINEKIKKVKKLDYSSFVNGLVIIGKDTSASKIYLKNNKISTDFYYYILVKNDNNELIAYSPRDITGFLINGQAYLSHCTDINGIKSYSFIHQVIKGRVNLYEREGTAESPEFTYLFKKQNSNYLSSITPFSENIRFNRTTVLDDGSLYFSVSTKQIGEKFKIAFMNYFSDCPVIVGKIKSGFYTIVDFEKIINDYNNCEK